ncbi:MAG TPA: hypothetical protein VNS62_05280 [Candidatus Udaeobacter sp.]|jgi:hypothetical protein|nr:hypothetical protein [Candidatus Udaeobacter sp.]
MRHKKWITVLMLLFVPLIAAAQLAQSERIATQVPFKFIVGNVAIPAGECSVQIADQGGWVLTVSNRDAKIATFTSAMPNAAKNMAPASALVFHKYGDRYFLVALKVSGSRAVYEFRQSKLEKELIAQNLRPTEEIVVASAR